MQGNVFLSALQNITAGRCSIGEVIDAATALAAAGESGLAEQIYKVWVSFNETHPHLYVAYFNCASVQSQIGNLAGAEESLVKALALKPDFYPGYINLGNVLERGGSVDRAMEQWQAIVDRLPTVTGSAIDHKLTAIKQLGRVFIDHHRPANAEAWLRQGLEIRPDQRDVLEQYTALRLGQCKWPVVEPWEGVERKTLLAGVSPLSLAAYTDDPLLHLAAAEAYIRASVPDRPHPDTDRRHAPIDIENRRMRIGYVSSDLREHAIGYLMAEMFELHDRSKVEVFAYYCGPDPKGDVNARALAAIEHWIDINGMDNEAAARQVAADGIDILVDINGLTRFARTGLFARRPAPIQVNWLGFPGSMGSPYHQYLIADEQIIPPASEIYYSEKVVRLPCYQPNDRKRAVVATPPTRADVGLPDDAFVYCCFNGSQKFTRFTFDRWIQILSRTPGSILWLLDSNPETNERLAAYAEAHGIERSRLVFAPKQANAYHLARYTLADLFLDTSPYGAHTTASDALWMGVPVLTLRGRAFAARVCSSLLHAAGLDELICTSPDEYVERAVAIGLNKAESVRFKQKIEENRYSCDLFNMNKLVDSLEGLYRTMCVDYQKGVVPQPNLLNLDVYLEAGVEEDHEAREMGLQETYHDLYKTKLAHRHVNRPLLPDGRLWTEADIARVEARPDEASAPQPQPLHRSADVAA